MGYISLKQASELWNISERRIRRLIQENRIEGAIKIGNAWNIPEETSKPIDKRYKIEEDKFVIDQSACISCGTCAGVCPVEAPVEE